jgi:peptidoglycan/xylan/chitin deacetylase (PgdA/CDA1 family)
MLGYAALFSGVMQNQLARAKSAGYSMILMYHRIIDTREDQGRIEPGMYVTRPTFARHLVFLKKYFNVVSLEKLAEAGSSTGDKKPRCAITFDDGWLDFAQHAFPLLMEHKVPATVFLPTGFIGTDDWFWTDTLAETLPLSGVPAGHADSMNLSSKANAIMTLHGPYGKRLDESIKILKELDSVQIGHIIDELNSVFRPSPRQKKRAFLNWNEVASMAKSGLVAFGSHTVNHHILTTLTSGKVAEELQKSRQVLIDHGAANPGFIPFCYPNGSHNDEIVGIARDAGYRCAVTTRSGWNHEKDDKLRLKRIAMHQDVSSNYGLLAYLASCARSH